MLVNRIVVPPLAAASSGGGGVARFGSAIHSQGDMEAGTNLQEYIRFSVSIRRGYSPLTFGS
jgi:hypothetical protein